MHTLVSSKHELPKSIILMADLPGSLSSMFSGLRSQCTMRCFLRARSEVSSWMAKRRMSGSETPWEEG